MKVSVIIPFHNYPKYLRDCLDSLKEQRFKDFEVLLVLDSNNTENLWDDYKQSMKIKILELENKKGVAAARNAGLDHATGKYVLFLDSDDYLLTDALERMVDKAEKSNAQLVYSKCLYTYYSRKFFTTNELNGNEDDASNAKMEEMEEGSSGTDIDEAIRQNKDSKEILHDGKRNEAIHTLLASKKEMYRLSVLGVLFERSLLEKFSIRFREDVVYYSDFPFLAEALYHGERFEFLEPEGYVKRRHNDPINMPALSQRKDENSFDDLIKAYQYAKEKIGNDGDVRRELDKKIIRFYNTDVTPIIRKKNSRLWREERFQVMKGVVGGMDKEVIRSVPRYERKLIKYLLNGDVSKTIKATTKHNGFRMFGFLIKHPKEIKRFVYKHYYLKKPLIEDCIVFETFFGRNYSDNPKYIYEYISEKYPDRFQCIWFVNKKKKNLPYKAKQVKRFSFSYYKYMARSKYFVFNSKQPKFYVKRKGSVFLETWHGTPLKKLVFDMEDVAGAAPLNKEHFYMVSRYWDYLVSANPFSTEVFRRAFMYDKKILEYGYPRNDILHREGKETLAMEVKQKLSIPEGKKVILYAPTWRDDEFYGAGRYKFQLRLDLDLIRQRLGDECVVLLRTHYLIENQLKNIPGMEGFVYHLSKYDDIAELYLISDILITDYSSVFFDFANLKRPMLFFTYDMDKYKDVLRGLYIDMEKELPGPLLYTSEEVVDALCDIENVSERYKEKYEAFYNKYCGLENGRASENIVNEVFQLGL